MIDALFHPGYKNVTVKISLSFIHDIPVHLEYCGHPSVVLIVASFAFPLAGVSAFFVTIFIRN
jgi:hypothetical protein